MHGENSLSKIIFFSISNILLDFAFIFLVEPKKDIIHLPVFGLVKSSGWLI